MRYFSSAIKVFSFVDIIFSFLLRSFQTYTPYIIVVWVFNCRCLGFHRHNGVLGFCYSYVLDYEFVCEKINNRFVMGDIFNWFGGYDGFWYVIVCVLYPYIFITTMNDIIF